MEYNAASFSSATDSHKQQKIFENKQFATAYKTNKLMKVWSAPLKSL